MSVNECGKWIALAIIDFIAVENKTEAIEETKFRHL